MKHVSNKSNIDILRDYVAGVRPFTQVGYKGDKDNLRAIGEKWVDASGVEWEQKNGYRTIINRQANIIHAAMEQRCKCGQIIKWGTRLDELFFNKTGLCENCLINYETKLRIIGVYPDYEKYKLLSNELGFLRDAKEKIKEVIKYFSENRGDIEAICNSEGFVERWKNTNRKQILADAKRDLKEVIKRIIAVSKEKEKFQASYVEQASKYKLETYV